MPFVKQEIMNYSIWAIMVLIVGSAPISAQDTQSFFVDAAFQRFNMREFDLRLSEPNFKDRMFCDNWCDSKVIAKIDTIDIKFNIDLSGSIFYENLNNRVLSIRNDFVKSFIIDERFYINYLLPETSETMILELIVEGNYDLYKHHDIVFHPPNFNVILNVGDKDGFYKKRYDHYAYCHDQLLKIPSKSKKALKKLQQECNAPSSINAKGDIANLFIEINKIKK